MTPLQKVLKELKEQHLIELTEVTLCEYIVRRLGMVNEESGENYEPMDVLSWLYEGIENEIQMCKEFSNGR